MKVEIYPSVVSGTVTPPTSKSIIHRAIICAALAEGTSSITNVDFNDDINATLSAFENMGVEILKDKKSITINSKGYTSFNLNRIIDCNESGSTIRFLIPVLSHYQETLFLGKSSLIKRPFTVYEEIFKNQKLHFKIFDEKIVTKGMLSPGIYNIPGNISSQFVSGLLFILPLLNGNSVINIEGEFESSQYVDITVNMMKEFGVNVTKTKNSFYITGNQKYHSNTIEAEVDYSQTAFFAVLGMINNDVTVLNLNKESLQPDRRIIDIINKMNGHLEFIENNIIFKKSSTQGDIIDVSQCPDIAPILGLLAACSNKETKIINAKRLIMKESNRLESTFVSLKKLGVDISIDNDSLVINGTSNLHGTICDSFNDHRIAMMLAIAGTVCDSKLTIENAEAINKSYPNFYKDLESLGVKIKYL